MKFRSILSIGSLFLLGACNMTTPDKYFDVAVLNANTIGRFGGKEIYEMLHETPNSYDEKSKKMVQSSYVDYVKFKIAYSEKALKDIQELKETDETKSMLEASKDLFDYTMDKERTGYVALAAMKDNHVSDDSIKAAAIDFNQKYMETFGQKYDKLMEIGKAFAAKHNIKAEFHTN